MPLQVFARLRPLNGKEEEGGTTCLQVIGNAVEYSAGHQQYPSAFLFDGVLQGQQEDVFKASGIPLVEHCLAGYNACILAYGQTGSGKTHTMMGQLDSETERGLAPRVFEILFSRLREDKDQEASYSCLCSFLEIYNEQVIDLLNPSTPLLRVKEDPLDQGFYVAQLQEEEVHSVEEVMNLLRRGAQNRRTAETHQNRASSRSHSIFSFTLTKTRRVNDHQVSVTRSQMKLVDLAGSERGANEVGIIQKEANFINLSLTTFGRVVTEIVEAQHHGGMGHTHIPYRDSVLTKLLKSSLEGNAKAQIIANVSPAASCGSETLSTLQFAQRAKGVRMKAVINQDLREEVLMRKLQAASEALLQQQAKAQEQEEQAMALQSAESAAVLLSEEARQRVERLEADAVLSRHREEQLVLEIDQQKLAHTEEKQTLVKEQARQVRVLQARLEEQEQVMQQQATQLREQQTAAEEWEKQVKQLQTQLEEQERLVKQQAAQWEEQRVAEWALRAKLEQTQASTAQQADLAQRSQEETTSTEAQFHSESSALQQQLITQQQAAVAAQETLQQQLTAQQILTSSAQAATAAMQEQLGSFSQRAEESAAKQAAVILSLAAELSANQAAQKQQAGSAKEQQVELQNQLANKTTELQQLQLALSTVEIQYAAATKENALQVKDLEGELQAVQEQVVQLQQQAQSLRDQLQEQITAQRQAATAAQGTQELLQKQLAAQQRLTASAQQATAAVQEQLAAAHTRAAESVARHSALVRERSDAEASRAAVAQQSSLDGMHAELDAVRASNRELQGSREQGGNQVVNLQAELSTAHQSQAAFREQQQAKLHALLASKDAEVQRLQAALAAAHKQHARAVAGLQQQLRETKGEVLAAKGLGSLAL
ncbi:P-loop containing nucleoside triphosphate hydrolase protein [Dunaliella salina]|uniref:Kinesin-like protein n=1 Tax=Dunaliella salina TaxID=3046 RepID=A0ABQ7G4V9_DUNSA|nr:P-loop containing nucleoside triphosphate hydrolase protein [Dunaliella salina]|eukprot:KAF5829627.1 P-loop containing nucleoside triphosphate hydrolase protein [Dunaliella salina]